MQHSYPATHGPSRPSSRRQSPTNLDSAEFSAGAAQPQGRPYDPPRMSATTTTTNQLYQSATQAGYPYYLQAAASSYHTQTATSASSHQNYNVYPTNTQSYQQTGASYQSAPMFAGTSSSYYDSSAQPSINYTPDSIHQHAAAAYSSTSQPVPSVNHASSEKRTKPSKPTASTSRRPKDSNPDMNSKMGRWRLGGNPSAQPASQLFAVGELKRKDRAPSPTETASATEAPTNKKAKPATTGAGTSQGAQRSDAAGKAKKHRDKLNRDIAELATRLPHHLQLFEDKPSVANIRQAIIHIDELENEAAQLRGAHVACQQEIYRLESVNYENREQIHALRCDLGIKDARIGELERELQTCQYSHPRRV
ncbi:hypothetical protein EWM64_g2777 [Hericium alpestre]|uniref:BHLH domain-containing protein n=1 Tax=Hericium alpestre TaxID=135208 RepID=A0A4Z0A3C3_9AGAM|nr:hypothetical protein EWM64_g2777 [Hericium alpestre]